MIEFIGKKYIDDYMPYRSVLEEDCKLIKRDKGQKDEVNFDVERYLCPCGMVKVTTGPGQNLKIEADSCGFK